MPVARRIVDIEQSRIAGVQLHLPIIPTGNSQINSRAASSQRTRRNRSRLQRLPRHLQQHPLLRVHHRRLARSNSKERRIELIDVS